MEVEKQQDKEKEPWLSWVVELQGLAQAGLYYTKDRFDEERYTRIRELAAEMLAYQAAMPLPKVQELFCNEIGYQTPKLDTRAAIFDHDQILLVQESDGRWSLPGGWVDVNVSVKENAIKEVLEEAGLIVSADRIIAIQDRDKHNVPVYAYKVCKVFVQCSVLGGSFTPNIETLQSQYFSLEKLPELASEKNTKEQIELCFEAYRAGDLWETQFD